MVAILQMSFSVIFFYENVWISIHISLKYIPKGPINNNPALGQIMAWRWTGDKPLSEPKAVLFTDANTCHLASMSWLIVAQWCHMVTKIWVNIGSGNGLLPDGTKPLPEPMLTYRQ